MIRRTDHVEGVMYADDIPEGTDYLPGTTDPISDDYERHYCEEDGEDWPCRTSRALQTLRDYLGGVSGGQWSDADLWEFAEEAYSDLTRVLSDPKEEQTNGDARMPGSKVGESATLSSGRDERECASAEDENERPPHEIHAASVSEGRES